MIGFVVGIATGAIQFWLLTRFTRHVTRGGITSPAVLLGFLQLLLPFGVLLAVALLRRQDLVLAGAGISGALNGGLFVRYILVRLKKSRGKCG